YSVGAFHRRPVSQPPAINQCGSRQNANGFRGLRRIRLLIYFLVIMSMPFLRHQFWDAEFGPGLTVTKLLGAICLLYALVYLGRRHAVPGYFATPQSKLMLLFFGIAAFSYLS